MLIHHSPIYSFFKSLNCYPQSSFAAVLFLLFCLLHLSAGAAQAATITVRSGGDVQAAINSAQGGDTIILEAGASFTGAISLPNKAGSSFITIESSRSAELAEGVRVSAADAAKMARIVAPGQNEPALRTQPGAHHYQLIGIEFAPKAADTFVSDMVVLGDTGANQNTLAQVPHDIIIDRVFIHSFDQTTPLKRGITLNSAQTSIKNSYIAGVKGVGQDTQAICGWNGPGPFQIENNYLEAAGENVMFGGADASIPNLVPSDITLVRNHLYKPVEWKTQNWSVKNLFELKNARRVVVNGNVMENCWTNAQAGYAIQFTVRNQDGGNPWAVVEDVLFQNNKVLGAESGFNLLGRDNNHPSRQVNNIRVVDNVIEVKNRMLQITGVNNVLLDHNTASGSIYAYGDASTRVVITNNNFDESFWMGGDNAGLNQAMLDQYYPGLVMRGNLVQSGNDYRYPSGNFYTKKAAPTTVGHNPAKLPD